MTQSKKLIIQTLYMKTFRPIMNRLIRILLILIMKMRFHECLNLFWTVTRLMITSLCPTQLIVYVETPQLRELPNSHLESCKRTVSFTEVCGVPDFIKSLDNPEAIDIFELFMTDNLFEHITFQTNLYAQQEFQKLGKHMYQQRKQKCRRLLEF